jgi:hypothetical protein
LGTIMEMRSAWLVVAIGCVSLAMGCETAAQKCAKARDAAGVGWAGYVETLEQAHSTASNAQRDAEQKLTVEVEPRLGVIATQTADGKYPRSSGAWLRAYRIAYEDLCGRDQQCKALRGQSSDAKSTIEDLADREPLARAAMRAMSGDVEAAKAAAKAAVPHPEFPQLRQAQQLAQVVYERCKDVSPAKPQ